MNKPFYLLFICISILSCTRTLDNYIPSDADEHASEINGLSYTIPKHLNSQQIHIITEIVDNMIFVKGGLFPMGQIYIELEDIATGRTFYPRSNEEPIRYVKLSDFWISKYELSPQQVSSLLDRDLPDKLNWTYQDWEYIIDLLRFYTGLSFDFPTEAQWEYSAKGGELSKGYLYPGSDNLKNVRTSSTDIHKVKEPNELGIYNMADHYSEWCKDHYQDYMISPMLIDPLVKNGTGHVVRGANYTSSWFRGGYGTDFEDFSFITWMDEFRTARSSARLYHEGTSEYIGLRPVINNNLQL